MTLPEDTVSLDREELLALVAQLQQQVSQLQRQVAQLAASNETLQAENAELKRGAKRQAAPFSKGNRVSQPKRPGRKPGEGAFSFRQAPRPEEITEPPVNVPVTLESCPACGGKLAEKQVDFAYITDLPPSPQPKVTQYRVGSASALGVAAGFEVSILTWPQTSMEPLLTGWASGSWLPPILSTTRWGFQCVRYRWCWRLWLG